MRRAAALAGAAAAIARASCDDVNVHILSASPYEQAQGCLEAEGAIDVVQGPSTGDNCAPTCLVSSGDDQTNVYVTTVCPPYPGDYASEALDAAAGDPCFGVAAAYAAFVADGATCVPIEAGDALARRTQKAMRRRSDRGLAKRTWRISVETERVLGGRARNTRVF